MKRTAAFHVVSRQRGPEPRIALAREGGGGEVVVDAATLLAQYGPGEDVLLVLDEDTPYEERLHLVLVRGAVIIDHLLIGAPYATGSYRELGSGGDALRFAFSDDGLRLSVDAAGLRGPRPLPPGVRRRGWWGRRYLRLVRDLS